MATKEATHESSATIGRASKFEFGATRAGRQARLSLFDVLRCEIIIKGWVEFRCEESEKQVEEIDEERIADDVPSLCDENSQHEEKECATGEGPSLSGEGSCRIKESLQTPLLHRRGCKCLFDWRGRAKVFGGATDGPTRTTTHGGRWSGCSFWAHHGRDSVVSDEVGERQFTVLRPGGRSSAVHWMQVKFHDSDGRAAPREKLSVAFNNC